MRIDIDTCEEIPVSYTHLDVYKRQTGKQHPSFKAGDTVTVAYRIVEGNKERVQLLSLIHI